MEGFGGIFNFQGFDFLQEVSAERLSNAKSAYLFNYSDSPPPLSPVRKDLLSDCERIEIRPPDNDFLREASKEAERILSNWPIPEQFTRPPVPTPRAEEWPGKWWLEGPDVDEEDDIDEFSDDDRRKARDDLINAIMPGKDKILLPELPLREWATRNDAMDVEKTLARFLETSEVHYLQEILTIHDQPLDQRDMIRQYIPSAEEGAEAEAAVTDFLLSGCDQDEDVCEPDSILNAKLSEAALDAVILDAKTVFCERSPSLEGSQTKSEETKSDDKSATATVVFASQVAPSSTQPGGNGDEADTGVTDSENSSHSEQEAPTSPSGDTSDLHEMDEKMQDSGHPVSDTTTVTSSDSGSAEEAAALLESGVVSVTESSGEEPEVDAEAHHEPEAATEQRRDAVQLQVVQQVTEPKVDCWENKVPINEEPTQKACEDTEKNDRKLPPNENDVSDRKEASVGETLEQKEKTSTGVKKDNIAIVAPRQVVQEDSEVFPRVVDASLSTARIGFNDIFDGNWDDVFPETEGMDFTFCSNVAVVDETEGRHSANEHITSDTDSEPTAMAEDDEEREDGDKGRAQIVESPAASPAKRAKWSQRMAAGVTQPSCPDDAQLKNVTHRSDAKSLGNQANISAQVTNITGLEELVPGKGSALGEGSPPMDSRWDQAPSAAVDDRLEQNTHHDQAQDPLAQGWSAEIFKTPLDHSVGEEVEYGELILGSTGPGTPIIDRSRVMLPPSSVRETFKMPLARHTLSEPETSRQSASGSRPTTFGSLSHERMVDLCGVLPQGPLEEDTPHRAVNFGKLKDRACRSTGPGMPTKLEDWYKVCKGNDGHQYQQREPNVCHGRGAFSGARNERKSCTLDTSGVFRNRRRQKPFSDQTNRITRYFPAKKPTGTPALTDLVSQASQGNRPLPNFDKFRFDRFEARSNRPVNTPASTGSGLDVREDHEMKGDPVAPNVGPLGTKNGQGNATFQVGARFNNLGRPSSVRQVSAGQRTPAERFGSVPHSREEAWFTNLHEKPWPRSAREMQDWEDRENMRRIAARGLHANHDAWNLYTVHASTVPSTTRNLPKESVGGLDEFAQKAAGYSRPAITPIHQEVNENGDKAPDFRAPGTGVSNTGQPVPLVQQTREATSERPGPLAEEDGIAYNATRKDANEARLSYNSIAFDRRGHISEVSRHINNGQATVGFPGRNTDDALPHCATLQSGNQFAPQMTPRDTFFIPGTSRSAVAVILQGELKGLSEPDELDEAIEAESQGNEEPAACKPRGTCQAGSTLLLQGRQPLPSRDNRTCFDKRGPGRQQGEFSNDKGLQEYSGAAASAMRSHDHVAFDEEGCFEDGGICASDFCEQELEEDDGVLYDDGDGWWQNQEKTVVEPTKESEREVRQIIRETFGAARPMDRGGVRSTPLAKPDSGQFFPRGNSIAEVNNQRLLRDDRPRFGRGGSTAFGQFGHPRFDKPTGFFFDTFQLQRQHQSAPLFKVGATQRVGEDDVPTRAGSVRMPSAASCAAPMNADNIAPKMAAMPKAQLKKQVDPKLIPAALLKPAKNSPLASTFMAPRGVKLKKADETTTLEGQNP
ncbi:uncharacterized protein LOC144161639 [Haemaphysalis longicornis]